MLEIKFRETENHWDTKTVMEIWHNDKLIAEHYDGGEPEDNFFSRDWNWVPEVIKTIYKLGIADGGEITAKEILAEIKFKDIKKED